MGTDHWKNDGLDYKYHRIVNKSESRCPATSQIQAAFLIYLVHRKKMSRRDRRM